MIFFTDLKTLSQALSLMGTSLNGSCFLENCLAVYVSEVWAWSWTYLPLNLVQRDFEQIILCEP